MLQKNLCIFILKHSDCVPRPGSLIVSSLEEIVKNEGIKGMYRGLSPTILALLPTWAVSMLSCKNVDAKILIYKV